MMVMLNNDVIKGFKFLFITNKFSESKILWSPMQYSI